MFYQNPSLPPQSFIYHEYGSSDHLQTFSRASQNGGSSGTSVVFANQTTQSPSASITEIQSQSVSDDFCESRSV